MEIVKEDKRELFQKIIKMTEYCNEKYPTISLKPKAETGVLNFLQKYPQYNGENVTIAILGEFSIHKIFMSFST